MWKKSVIKKVLLKKEKKESFAKKIEKKRTLHTQHKMEKTKLLTKGKIWRNTNVQYYIHAYTDIKRLIKLYLCIENLSK